MIPQGNILQGNPVSDNKFQGVTSLAQIASYGLARPTAIDKNKKNLTDDQKKAHELHAVTNRTFTKDRLDNAEDYSGYIEGVEMHGRLGGTPAITLYHSEPIEIIEGGAIIPYGSAIVAIDGETQTEARYILAERVPESKNNVFAITLYHGIPVDAAMQILHDYNIKGVPWNESKAARFNRTGQLSLAGQTIIEAAGIPQEKINYRGDKATRKHLLSLKQLLTGVVGYQLNGKGSEIGVSAAHFKRFNDASAVSVPTTCTDHFTTIVRNLQQDPMISTAPVMVWQIAGVLLSKNFQPGQLNWKKACEAFDQTKSSGRGGPRMPIKARLAAVESAMSSR